ncbi:DHA2 family efflux MFS transporter permease subunit [Streptomyces dangxiongensis]|uniref:DHA2 family efflux MFS transporter permease subunit n=1 Tax=Streptomyces dangxiongensis TaxID=1442032 RepID=A0A3G2JLZ7_9ACTN|nr:MFS transporter [Streptomyces dangxiongensis]AYN42641.1 DHA2 family efflux MFS transporter permease subunit [Streptomyces dangxiongensis]
MSTVQARPAPDDRRWKALGVCLAAGFISLLDTSIVNVALPSMEHGLGASQAAQSWVVSGYALTFGLALVPAGRLGDMHGRRRAFLFGLALFTVASAACGLAPGPSWLVLFRLIQGTAAGMVAPQTSGLIQQMFQGAERAKAFGLLGSVIGVSTAVGPLAGGLLIDAVGTDDGWRWVFFVNLPIGAAAFVAGLRLLPRFAAPAGKREEFDPFGVLLLGAGVLALMLPLVQEQQWTGREKWALMPVAVVLLGAFWVWERRQGLRGHAPLVDLALFSLRSFTLGALVSLSYFAGFTTVFFVYTLYLQNNVGYSALAAGLSVLPFAAASAVGAAIGGRLVLRFGRTLVVIGLSGVALGLLGVVAAVELVPGRGVGWASALPMLIGGIGSGLTVSPNTTLTLTRVPVHRAGAAGGVLQTGQRVGSAAGIAVVGAVYFAHLANHGSAGTAVQLGLLTAVGIILVALVLAIADLRERHVHPEPGRTGEAVRRGSQEGGTEERVRGAS